MDNNSIITFFSDIMSDTEGIVGFVSNRSSQYLMKVLKNFSNSPMTKVQFDQLLALQNLQSMSDGFFEFYWLSKPQAHYYEIDHFEVPSNTSAIISLEHLKWGFTRVFIDCLFAFGNIQKGYDTLCRKTYSEISDYFKSYTVDAEQIRARGNTLHFESIAKEDRYLISEMACKTFANLDTEGGLVEKLIQSYKKVNELGIKRPTFRNLLDGKYYPIEENKQISMFPEICLEDILEDSVESLEELRQKAERLAARFNQAHSKALKNTELYLSLVNDLDVYVATSMRNKKNFQEMAEFCEKVFKSDKLREYDLRYFDPTISAADSHEDKGLIECLMVKSARMLIYSSGQKDSYGKDVEAAMALCLGKPTIFYCPEKNGRANFFKDVHPLSRLVNFANGVASGVIVCVTTDEVIEIVNRIITNTMKYEIVKKAPDRAYYLLKETYTGSIVRIQTDNALLSSAFWHNY